MPMNALIVEDEPRAQRILENLLRTHFPEVAVTGVTASVNPASAISVANVSRKQRTVTPRNGARIRFVI